MADGWKLNPFVVFKGVQLVAELNSIPGVVVALSKNGWINEKLTNDWVKRVWGVFSFEKRLLVWDAYKCHLLESVKHEVQRATNTDIVMIPGGLTSLVQPAHVCWNKPFKEAYHHLYDD